MSVFVVSIQASVPWHQRGAATSSTMFLRFMGQVIGVSGCGAVLNATILRMDPGAARAMDRMLDLDPVSRAVFRLPAGDGGLTNLLHERAVVLETRYDGDWCEVEAQVPESVRRRLAAYIVQ